MKKVADLRSGLIACARGIAGSLFLLLLLSSLSLCQLTTYHINSAPDTPLSGANQSDYDTYALSTSYPGSLMTGATVDLHWNTVDTGTATSGCPNITTANWTAFDNTLTTIINSGKFVNFIVMPVQEGGVNSDTPAYVFTQVWANNLADGGCSGLGSGDVLVWAKDEAVLPGNYIYANTHYWQETAQPWSSSHEFVGTCTTGSTEPAFVSTVSSYTDNNCTWTNVGTNAPPQDVCFSSFYSGNFGNNYGCFNVNDLPSGQTLTSLETGFLVSYETPMKTAYKNFIQQVINHYQDHAPANLKLGYIRFGLSEGGETVPLVSSSWPYFNNPTGKGPASGASIVYLSYDYEMMVFQNANNQRSGSNPPINMQADLNTWDGITDYPDQEALYATEENIGIGTNGLEVNDVTSIANIGCTSPSTSANPISGDWCYNFHEYCSTKMPNGNYPICSLQTLLWSTPGNNTAGETGSLSAEGSFPGLLPIAKQYGANNLEIYTCDVLYTVMYAYPTNNYPGTTTCPTTHGNPADPTYENNYQGAFGLYLNSSEPGIYSPAPGADMQSDSSITLTWNAYPGATSYTVQVGSSEGTQTYYHSSNAHSPQTINFSPSLSSGTVIWVRWTPNNSTALDYNYVAP
jgi:hypothetical protein